MLVTHSTSNKLLQTLLNSKQVRMDEVLEYEWNALMSCQATVFASLGRLPSLVQKADATCCASWILAAHETNHTPFWAFPTANLSVGLNLFVVCLQMLIDPVCLLTCCPKLLRNFIYEWPKLDLSLLTPAGFMDLIRFACSRDLIVAEVSHIKVIIFHSLFVLLQRLDNGCHWYALVSAWLVGIIGNYWFASVLVLSG
jgi:hypothetical protein